MANQTNYEGLSEHLDYQGETEYEAILAQEPDAEVRAAMIAADLLYMAEHPDEFE